jgi:very-short-patch-repair endonuclease
VVLGKRYIADFFAPALRLVVEVDGSIHERTRRADARRDERLRRLGYRILRLDGELVVHQLPVAVARVREAVRHAGQSHELSGSSRKAERIG